MSFLLRLAGPFLKDRVRSLDFWERIWTKPLCIHIGRRQLGWLEYLFQVLSGQVPWRLFQAWPNRKRPRGCPRTHRRYHFIQTGVPRQLLRQPYNFILIDWVSFTQPLECILVVYKTNKEHERTKLINMPPKFSHNLLKVNNKPSWHLGLIFTLLQ